MSAQLIRFPNDRRVRGKNEQREISKMYKKVIVLDDMDPATAWVIAEVGGTVIAQHPRPAKATSK